MRIARSFAFQIYFFCLTLLMGLGAIPLRFLKRRNAALKYAQLWSRLTLFGFRKICRVHICVTGREHLSSGPCLIASQHQSFFDGFIWMTLVPRPSYVIKKELTKIPLVGPMLILSGMIPVERSAGSKALRALVKDAQTQFQALRQVIIFPQGTRVIAGEQAKIQPGIAALAKHAQVPILPVVTNSGSFWPRKGWLKNSGTLQVVIGPVINIADDQRKLIPLIEASWRELESRQGLYNRVDKSVD